MDDYFENVDRIYQVALATGDMEKLSSEAVVACSGQYTGRVPQYKRIVDNVPNIDWGEINMSIDEDEFDILKTAAVDYLGDDYYTVDGWVGDGDLPTLNITCKCLRPYHALFINNMIRRKNTQPHNTVSKTLTIYNAGQYAAPVTKNQKDGVCVALNLKSGEIVILGTEYAGEMKKGVFTFAHYYYPTVYNALTLHSSCVVGPEENNVTMFFGLSGTGKTTLSADSLFKLIGDDEHVWTNNGVFNIEGGCYAKVLGLSKEKEPEIWAAIKKGSVFENVIHSNGEPNFNDDYLTKNTRLSYPLFHYPNLSNQLQVDHPQNIIFLTCDAFGAFPSLSRIPADQIENYFLAGYTSKMPGTEVEVIEPEPVYSACYAAPFLPLAPKVYAKLLRKKVEQHHCQVWLLNTGWFDGKRIPLEITRRCVRWIVLDQLPDQFIRVPETGLEVPAWLKDNVYHHPELHFKDYAARVEKVFKNWPST